MVLLSSCLRRSLRRHRWHFTPVSFSSLGPSCWVSRNVSASFDATFNSCSRRRALSGGQKETSSNSSGNGNQVDGKSNEGTDDDSSSSSPSSSSPPPTQRVTVNVDSTSGICQVQLNRPNKLNAVDLPMFEAIAQAAHDLQTDRSIRVIVLSGNGRSFCSGLDVSSVMKNFGSSLSSTMERLLERPSGYGRKKIGNLAQDVAMLWRELPVPVIAVLHGHCYGAGLQIALGADIRYCSPTTRFSVMEGKWGLIPDMGASVLLRETVGRIDVCKELTMTGRVVHADEAWKLGLVTRVCRSLGDEENDNNEDKQRDVVMDEAMKLAKTLVERSPDALAATKQLYQNTWMMSDEIDALKEETRLQRKLLVSWNQIAASSRSALGLKIPYFNRKD